MIYAGVQGMVVHVCCRFLRGSCGLKSIESTGIQAIIRRFLRGSCGLKLSWINTDIEMYTSLSTRKLWIEIPLSALTSIPKKSLSTRKLWIEI